MGNTCVTRREREKDTKLDVVRSISNSIWGPSPQEKFGYDNKDGNNTGPSISKEHGNCILAQRKPPELVIIVRDGVKTSNPIYPKEFIDASLREEESQSKAIRWDDTSDDSSSIFKSAEVNPVTHTDREDALSGHIPRYDHGAMTGVGRAKLVEAPKPKVPPAMKRMASAGLQVDSVLRTKTGHLKEYYNLGDKLGKGQFGTTFLCVERTTGKKYACKSIAKRKLLTEDDVDDVRREVEIMHHLSGSPNIISIKDAYEDSVAVHVVMELCTGGELFDRIVKVGHYSERKAADLIRTIVGVIQTCHSLGVMHRDLKPENFLFVNEGEDSQIMAIDFGLSMFFKPGEIFNDVVGSPYYVAPEVLSKRYGPEADIWSAGVILYILLSGVPPFWGENEEEIFKEVLQGGLDFKSNPWPHISESAKDLVRRMLVRDPKRRPTAHEVLCHPWVRVDGVAPDKPLDPAVLSRFTRFSAMNKFKKMALRVIAASLSDEEIAGLREMFKMIDTDNSGAITFEELKAGLKRFGANLNESEIYKLMRAADIDNNGTIDYGEFVAATLHLNKIEKGDYLYAAFSYFDKDGSGYITLDELQKACDEFGIQEGHLDDMMKEADQNNDGRIDYDEFAAMMHKEITDLGTSPFRNNLNVGYRERMQIH